MVAQSKAGRTSVACQGCFLSCQSNRLGNVHRQIPKLTLSSPIGFSGRRLRQGPSDQWELSLQRARKRERKEVEGGDWRWLPRIRTCTPTRSTPCTTSSTARAQAVSCACASSRPPPPSPLPQVVSLCLQTSPGLCFSTPAGPDVWVG